MVEKIGLEISIKIWYLKIIIESLSEEELIYLKYLY